MARQIKAIEAFEAQAMKGAEQTRLQVDREVKSLDKALRDIETARPFEDLTVVRFALLSLRLNPSRRKRSLMRNDVLLTIGESQDEVCAAAPEIDKRAEWLVSRGRWSVPGYKVCIVPPFHIIGSPQLRQDSRKNSAISRSSRLCFQTLVSTSPTSSIPVYLYQ